MSSEGCTGWGPCGGCGGAGPRPMLVGMTNSTTTLPSAGFPSPRQHRGPLMVKKVLLWGVVSAVAVAGVLAL